MSKVKIVSGESLSQIKEYLREYNSVFMVYDMNASEYAQEIASAISNSLKGMFSMIAEEKGKSFKTVLAIEDWLLKCGADRNALLLAVGGGITTDISGFAASIYKRGIRFAFVPTTLLSQVDAAIGGKTGVNFHNYKNMIGVIRQPEFTFINAQVLESLSLRDFISGAAELLKTFIIKDNGNYQKAVKLLSEINNKDKISDNQKKQLQELIHAAALVKAEIVEQDEFETGERRKLNLGHTFAHAIEWQARRKKLDITHGEAVAMGIIQAAKLSNHELAEMIKNDFANCGLPTELPFPIKTLVAAMKKDKKAEGEKIHFVLIRSIGDVYIEDMTVEEAVERL